MTRTSWTLALPAALLVLALGGPVVTLIATVAPGTALGALRSPEIASAASVSLRASLTAVALALLLGVPAGYELARRSGFVRATLTLIVALPLAFPPVAAGVMLLAIVGNRQPIGNALASIGLPVVDTFAGVVTAEFFACAPFVVIASSAAFAEIDPRLEEAARTLGAGPLGVFTRVALPLAARGIGAGALLGFLRAFGEYGSTAVVAYHPTSLPIALYTALASDGLERALAIAYLFAALAAAAIVVATAVRRRP